MGSIEYIFNLIRKLFDGGKQQQSVSAVAETQTISSFNSNTLLPTSIITHNSNLKPPLRLIDPILIIMPEVAMF